VTSPLSHRNWNDAPLGGCVEARRDGRDDDPSSVSHWLPAFARWLGGPPPPRITEQQAETPVVSTRCITAWILIFNLECTPEIAGPFPEDSDAERCPSPKTLAEVVFHNSSRSLS
jgi:hypothetical protein